MPITFHLDVVPTARGAQLFLRNGHGEFVPRDRVDAPFNTYQEGDEAILAAIAEFLKWERKTR